MIQDTYVWKGEKFIVELPDHNRISEYRVDTRFTQEHDEAHLLRSGPDPGFIVLGTMSHHTLCVPEYYKKAEFIKYPKIPRFKRRNV
jgi:hypothetical protein